MDMKIPKEYWDGAIETSSRYAWRQGLKTGLLLGLLAGIVIAGLVAHYALRVG